MKNFIYYYRVKSYYLFIVFFVILSVSNLFGQPGPSGGTAPAPNVVDLPTVISSSPTVANLMQFEEVPVSHYTGQPNISIPLYNKQISNTLNLNMTLSYSTQGIKLRNYSGWVGTGWNLEVGGVVSRTIRGLPDEKRKGDNLPGGANGTGVLNNSGFWNYGNNPNDEFVWNANGNSQDKFDYQSDLFQFSVLGLSGRFVIVKDNTGPYVPKLLTKNLNVKIDIDYTLDNSQLSSLDSFTITDTNGNRFVFDIKESLQSEVVTGGRLVNGGGFLNSSGPRFSVSSWFLSRIETSNFEELARFEYKEDDVNYSSRQAGSSNSVNTSSSDWPTISQNTYNASVLPPTSMFSINTITGDTQKLQKIIFVRDHSKIIFNSGGSHPETGGDILNEIIIQKAYINQNQNEIITQNKKFELNYDPITSQSRLWLMGIDEIADSTTYPYEFEYTNKDALTKFQFSSFGNVTYESIAGKEDNWGYLDGTLDSDFNSNCTASNDYFDHDLIKTGLLEKIIYPNGGVKEFEFEHNTITYSSIGGSVINSTGGQAVSMSHNYFKHNNSDNWSPAGGVSYSFDSRVDNFAETNVQNPVAETLVLYNPVTIKYKRTSAIVDTDQCANPEKDDIILSNAKIEIKGTGSNSNYLHNIQLNDSEETFALDAGTYEIRLFHLDNCAEIDVSVCFGFQAYNQLITSQFIYGGGVRIKEVRFYDKVEDTYPPLILREPAERKVSYDYRDADNNKMSSGTIDGSMNGQEIRYSQNYKRFLLSVDCPSMAIARTFLFNTKSRNAEVSLTQGQYVGYKTVSVSEENNGKTVYTFTSAQDDGFASPASTFNYPENTPAPNLDFKRGLLKNKRIFSQTNPLPIKEVINTYDFESTEISPSYTLYTNEMCEWKAFYNDYDNYINQLPENPLNLCFGGGGNGCDEDCIGSYFNCGGIPFIFLSNPIESGWAKLTETKTINYFYDDQNVQTLIESRQTLSYDITNFQVETQHNFIFENGQEHEYKTRYWYPIGGAPDYTDSSGALSGLIELNKINEVIATETYRDNVKLSRTNTYYKDFDSDSNPDEKMILPNIVEVAKGNDTPESRIEFHKYDEYGNPLEVSKANGVRIMYVWGYGDTKPIAKIIGDSYETISNSVLSAINIAKNASNDDVDQNSENLLITVLNNLRNHSDLLNAQVTTLTYDPLRGITSVTDPKGYLITYHYDEFNRLEHVKDKDGNILSENEYNYKNQY